MEIPHASLKDLRSTGYFFDELKSYSQSPEMDLTTYCVDYAIPYLEKVSESYAGKGQFDRSRILRLAIKHLSNPEGCDIADLVLGLRKVAASEVDKAGKADFGEQLDKAGALANRRKSESAEFLIKLLVNIIKTFKLADQNANQKKSDDAKDPALEAIMHSWEAMEAEGA